MTQAVVEWTVENSVEETQPRRMDEEALVRRCREGDLMAYRSLYERYEQPFLRTALRLLGRQQDAEDAVQETFFKFYKKIHHYRKDRLETVDAQIRRCREALESNPANAHIRRYLMAALLDKKETLAEVLNLKSGTPEGT